MNDVFLTHDEDPVRRIDAAETRAWRALVAPILELAAE
jgi:hypothetical protein